jgi:hypothetical protein
MQLTTKHAKYTKNLEATMPIPNIRPVPFRVFRGQSFSSRPFALVVGIHFGEVMNELS